MITDIWQREEECYMGLYIRVEQIENIYPPDTKYDFEKIPHIAILRDQIIFGKPLPHPRANITYSKDLICDYFFFLHS